MAKTLRFVSPYSDGDMEFDESSERYSLTFEYAKSQPWGNNFRSDDELRARLKANSRLIYSYMRNRGYSANWRFAEKVLNRTEEGRGFLLDVLSAQMEADAESGYNDLAKASPIDLAQGRVLDRNEIRRNQISVLAEDIIDSSASYFGFNILYRSAFPSALAAYIEEA